MDIDFAEKTVYLAAPKRILRTDLYDRAFRYFLARSKAVMNPLWMFQNNEDWLANYETVLADADVMVIVTDDNFVGKGVYLECNFFFSRHCPIYYFLENEIEIDPTLQDDVDPDVDFIIDYEHSIVKVKRLEIDDGDNWTDYAVVKY